MTDYIPFIIACTIGSIVGIFGAWFLVWMFDR